MFTSELELKHIVVIAALYLIIFIAMSFTIRIVPYSKDSIFAVEFPYDGFTLTRPLGEAFSNIVNDQVIVNPQDIHGKNSIQGDTQCTKVDGFDELYCSPNYKPPMNEKFLGTPGGPSGNSYGLTNTMGKLQLTPEQTQLLNTRGGNSGGRPSEIGK